REPVIAARHQVDREQRLGERYLAVLEGGPDQVGKLVLAGAALLDAAGGGVAGPSRARAVAGCEVMGLVDGPAVGTDRAVGAADALHQLVRLGFVRELAGDPAQRQLPIARPGLRHRAHRLSANLPPFCALRVSLSSI